MSDSTDDTVATVAKPIFVEKPPRIKRTIRPIYEMVLIRHEKDIDKTPGGIILPDDAKIKTTTGVIVKMPDKMKENDLEYPFHEQDIVMYDIREAVPYNSDPRDKHSLVKAEFILGVIEEEIIDEDGETDLGSEAKERLAEGN